MLIALNDEMHSKNLTMAYYQLDAYWYHLEIAPGCCVVDWHAVSSQFPNGLQWLSTKLKTPLLLYTDTWCRKPHSIESLPFCKMVPKNLI